MGGVSSSSSRTPEAGFLHMEVKMSVGVCRLHPTVLITLYRAASSAVPHGDAGALLLHHHVPQPLLCHMMVMQEEARLSLLRK